MTTSCATLEVPSPALGQTVNDYRRETCRRFKRTFLPPIHDLYQVNYRGLRSDALSALEPQLLQACKVEANNPNTVTPGEFRKIEVRNRYGQLQMTKFIDPECFVKQMGRPGRRVVAFMQLVQYRSDAKFPPNVHDLTKPYGNLSAIDEGPHLSASDSA